MAWGDDVKRWFFGPLYRGDSVSIIENSKHFTQSLKEGLPIFFTMNDGYGCVAYNTFEEIGVIFLKDGFGETEDYIRAVTLKFLKVFYLDHSSEGLHFFVWDYTKDY